MSPGSTTSGAASSEAGTFEFRGLAPGRYRLQVAHEGFGSAFEAGDPRRRIFERFGNRNRSQGLRIVDRRHGGSRMRARHRLAPCKRSPPKRSRPRAPTPWWTPCVTSPACRPLADTSRCRTLKGLTLVHFGAAHAQRGYRFGNHQPKPKNDRQSITGDSGLVRRVMIAMRRKDVEDESGRAVDLHRHRRDDGRSRERGLEDPAVRGSLCRLGEGRPSRSRAPSPRVPPSGSWRLVRSAPGRTRRQTCPAATSNRSSAVPGCLANARRNTVTSSAQSMP